jgi:hypothetical protein
MKVCVVPASSWKYENRNATIVRVPLRRLVLLMNLSRAGVISAVHEAQDRRQLLLVILPPTQQQTRVAFGIVVALLIAFCVTAPFSNVQLLLYCKITTADDRCGDQYSWVPPLVGGQLLMLWTALPPARNRHESGCC